ncbi:MAG: sigma-70 family RNA polymerase sigma factor [Bryobacteraceae bacterium]|nr:sigma-70 family RNA polymerase sigma factor [Bryobacteraceae bacterium]MDW8379655.1 sigma-70 family RNA polymerase sigma factor [Bryobacterales bacterium]
MADLYDQYGKLVFSVIFRIVKEGGVAEDLTQETFLRIWNRAQFFDHEKGALGPWILAVARNRAIDYLRSVEGRLAQRTTDFGPAREHPSDFVNLERDVIQSDRARLLREAFAKLSPNQRLVIEMAYYEGLSQTEMAQRMKQPLGTVKTWVRTALKILRQELDEVAPV